jgi:hypothetical protein
MSRELQRAAPRLFDGGSSPEADMSTSLVRRVIPLGLLAVAAARCGGSPTGPSSTGSSPTAQSLPLFAETANYIFRASDGDTIDTAWQERYHVWATAALGVTERQKIAYNKYTSRAHMQSVIGVGNTNAWADPAAYAVHTIWPIDNHEVVHLLTSGWGSPVALINEGMAVAFQIDPARDLTPRWSGVPLHELTRQFRQQGRFVPLAGLTETSSWRSQDPNVVYPESGSFMRWLIDEYGLDRIRALYARAAGPNEPAAGVRAGFAAVYGQTLDELERAWLAFVTP